MSSPEPEPIYGFFDPAFFDSAFFDTGELAPHRTGHGDAVPLPYRRRAPSARSYSNEMSRASTEYGADSARSGGGDV